MAKERAGFIGIEQKIVDGLLITGSRWGDNSMLSVAETAAAWNRSVAAPTRQARTPDRGDIPAGRPIAIALTGPRHAPTALSSHGRSLLIRQ